TICSKAEADVKQLPAFPFRETLRMKTQRLLGRSADSLSARNDEYGAHAPTSAQESLSVRTSRPRSFSNAVWAHLRRNRGWKASRAVLALALVLVAGTGCESTGGCSGSVSAGAYYGAGVYDPWYYGGDWDDPDIIVTPPDRPSAPPRPTHPIAPTPGPRPTPMPSLPATPRPSPRR